ncbi:tRNA (5-methylaminomethyl-2-thiouridylate)-methyltransferase [Candidatus Tremblaya phenacola PAVE]|nr:tRNA (5-methylaminomethyl-2-thiouridylate)-methyltransferase [Candidatus Tremblaya phenacola PAVE]
MLRACKIAVGLSGGIDSITIFWILIERNYEAIGFHMSGWFVRHSDAEWSDALLNSKYLGGKSYNLNLSTLYQKFVLNNLIASYNVGEVQNPDILCNWYIKFGALVSYLNHLGFEIFSTGHYARMFGRWPEQLIHQHPESVRDQSYFLYLLLGGAGLKISFPLGNIRKKDVRLATQTANFPNARKKDSVGICNVGPEDHTAFLIGLMRMKIGSVKNKKGLIIGEHIGTSFFSAGQKKLLNLRAKSKRKGCYYVCSVRRRTNELIITTLNQQNHQAEKGGLHLLSKVVGSQKQLKWIRFKAKSHQPKQEICSAFSSRLGGLSDKLPTFSFNENASLCLVITTGSQTIGTLGQHLVFYFGDFCLGGGQIIYSLKQTT